MGMGALTRVEREDSSEGRGEGIKTLKITEKHMGSQRLQRKCIPKITIKCEITPLRVIRLSPIATDHLTTLQYWALKTSFCVGGQDNL